MIGLVNDIIGADRSAISALETWRGMMLIMIVKPDLGGWFIDHTQNGSNVGLSRTLDLINLSF